MVRLRTPVLSGLLVLAGCETSLSTTRTSTHRGEPFDGGAILVLEYRSDAIPEPLDLGRVGRDSGAHPLDPMESPCPDDMVHVEDFCIDRYEAPNRLGEPPLAMQNALAGETWCAERGKELCSEAQWLRACQGASEREFPYGSDYRRGVCNDDKTWLSPDWRTLARWPSDAARAEAARLYQADPSGSRVECESEDGVSDLTGNVAEWVRRSYPHANNYDHVMKGCYWAGCFGNAPPSCGFTNPAHPSGFRSYEAGFRCCLEPN